MGDFFESKFERPEEGKRFLSDVRIYKDGTISLIIHYLTPSGKDQGIMNKSFYDESRVSEVFLRTKSVL
jgi:hypothetical protein